MYVGRGRTHPSCCIDASLQQFLYPVQRGVAKIKIPTLLYCRSGQATDEQYGALHGGYQRLHSQQVIQIALPLQQWLDERVSMLRCTYIGCFALCQVSPPVASGCTSEACSCAEIIVGQCPLCSVMPLFRYIVSVSFLHVVGKLPIVSAVCDLVLFFHSCLLIWCLSARPYFAFPAVHCSLVCPVLLPSHRGYVSFSFYFYQHLYIRRQTKVMVTLCKNWVTVTEGSRKCSWFSDA